MLRFGTTLLVFTFANHVVATETLDLCKRELLPEISDSLDKACYQQPLTVTSSSANHQQDSGVNYRLSPSNRSRTVELVKDMNRLQGELDAFCLRIKTSTHATKAECKGNFRSLQGQLQMITAEIGQNIPKLNGPNEKGCQKAHKKVQELLNSQDHSATTVRKQFKDHYKSLCPAEFPKTLFHMQIKGGGIPATRKD